MCKCKLHLPYKIVDVIVSKISISDMGKFVIVLKEDLTGLEGSARKRSFGNSSSLSGLMIIMRCGGHGFKKSDPTNLLPFQTILEILIFVSKK